MTSTTTSMMMQMRDQFWRRQTKLYLTLSEKTTARVFWTQDHPHMSLLLPLFLELEKTAAARTQRIKLTMNYIARISIGFILVDRENEILKNLPIR
jgi:hypothetical protein